jgi:hypothetical protein
MLENWLLSPPQLFRETLAAPTFTDHGYDKLQFAVWWQKIIGLLKDLFASVATSATQIQ